MSLYEPSRGGTRGGKDQFAWDDVKSDKYRENYLAHSLMAPVGRWQKGKDLTWYTKESKVTGRKEALMKEVAAVKQAEEEAMARALGHKLPVKKPVTSTSQHLTKREMINVCKRRSSEGNSTDVTGRDRIEGMGFKSQKTSLMMSGGAGPSEEGVTSFESDQTKSEDRLILKRRASDRDRISSVSSSTEQQPPSSLHQSSQDDHVTKSVDQHESDGEWEEKRKDKKRKRKHKKEKKKKFKKEKKTTEKRKRHRKREATPISDSTSSSDEEDRYHSNRTHNKYHKRTRHDTDH